MGVDLGMDGRDMPLPIFLSILNNRAALTPRNVNGKISAELPGLCGFLQKRALL